MFIVKLVSRTGIEPISTESESIIVSIRPPGHIQQSQYNNFAFSCQIKAQVLKDMLLKEV